MVVRGWRGSMSLMVSCRLLGGISIPLDFNQWQVVLVRQQTSDCAGSDVPNVNSPLVGGMLWATQLFDGNTSVKLAITARSSDPTLGNEPFRRSEKSIIDLNAKISDGALNLGVAEQ